MLAKGGGCLRDAANAIVSAAVRHAGAAVRGGVVFAADCIARRGLLADALRNAELGAYPIGGLGLLHLRRRTARGRGRGVLVRRGGR